MPNLFDGLLILILAGALFWGWKSGLLRQLVAVTAAMVAFMVAAQLHEPMGAIFNDFSLVRTPAFYQALSYLLVMFFVAAVWFVVIRRIYPYSRLGNEGDGTVRGLDSLAGMFLGLFLGVLLVIATIGVAELLAFGRWPLLESGRGRETMHYAIQESLMVRTLFKEAPDFADYLSHWVPGVAIAREGRIQP